MLTTDATGPKRRSSPLRLQLQAARMAYAPHTWGASYAQQHAIAREESPWTIRAKLLAVARCKMAGAVAGLAAGGARGAWAQAQPQMQLRIERLALELDKIISEDEPIKELASGFGG